MNGTEVPPRGPTARGVRTLAVAALFISLPAPGVADEPPDTGVRTSLPVFTGLSARAEAQLFTGAATTSIPIDVPPGRKNLTPSLALTYSSGGGPSPYGHGWDLPIGRIERSRRHGVLSCYDADARRDFVVSLPGASVECRLDTNGSDVRRRCRPRVEDRYLRIYHSAAENRWDVWDRDGLRYTFGAHPAARTGSATGEAWRDGPGCRSTHAWHLTRIADANHNHLDVEYESASGIAYPRHVQYGGNLGRGQGHSFEVRFIWKAWPSADQPTDARAGHLSRVVRLLDRVEVRRLHIGPTVRTYRFQHDSDTDGTLRTARSGFLLGVTLYGRAGTALARYDGLPAATVFRYREVDPTERTFHSRVAQAAPHPNASPTVLHEAQTTASRSATSVVVRDMNGDGIPDLVDTRDCHPLQFPYWKVYFGTGAGFTTQVRWWMTPAAEADRCLISVTRFRRTSSDTIIETTDINGDGIPDWINAGQIPWAVYLGVQARDDVEWGFGPVQFWQVPAPYHADVPHAIRVSDDGRDWLDLIDWNGDGLPDLVNAFAGQVHYNLGTGFEPTGHAVSFPSQRLRYSRGKRLIEALYDMNGDGLPDHVRVEEPGVWHVRLHEGRSFAQTQSTWSAPESCARDIRDKRGGTDTWRELLDIDGDGLPDLVDTCRWTTESPYWDVYVNKGSRFAGAPVLWNAPHARIRNETGSTVSRMHRDLFDIDGDGVPDVVEIVAAASRQLRVHHNGAGAFAVACGGSCVELRGAAAPPDALVSVDNGIGASTRLAYLPSTVWDNSDSYGFPRLPAILWTLTRIEQDGGMAGVVAGNSGRSLDIRYAYGLFHAPSREFRGFGTVQTLEADGTAETTNFGQDRGTKGRVLSVTTHAPGTVPGRDPPLRATTNMWKCTDAATGANTVCGNVESVPASMGVRLERSQVFDYDSAGSARRAWRYQVAWGPYGLPTQVRVGGDGSATIETYTSYAIADDLDSGGSTYQVALPAHVRVSRGGTVEEQWMFYDDLPFGQVAQGNLTRIESWLDTSVVPAPSCRANASKRCVATSMAYDDRGNVVRVVDARDGETTTIYAPDGIYPMRVVNAAGHVVEFGHDSACGNQLWETLPNSSERTAHVYDDFCRLVATRLPGQTSATEQQRIAYYLGGPGVATNLFLRQAEPHSPTGWVETDELYDGLGRRLQRQHATTVDGARVILAADTVRFDARGRGLASRAPFPVVQAFAGGAALYRPPPAGETTSFEYDALGRMIRVVRPDGSERRVDFSVPWQSAATGECFHAAGCEGSRTVQVVDAHGNTVEKQVLDERGDVMAKTRYSHDHAGRVTQVEQWDGSRWQSNTRIKTAYDSLGRRVRIDDPDSGLWEFGYDLAGNLVHQNDPVRRRHVELCYDALQRVTQKHIVEGTDTYGGPSRCDLPGAAAVEYSYDDPSVPYGTGRLARVEDTSGSTHFRAYDVRGNVIETAKSLRVGTYIESAVTRYRYDRAGHLDSVVYPDGEEVAYEYDEAGRVRALHSRGDGAVLLADLTYDAFGRPRQITHGNGPSGIGVVDAREYYDAGGGFRLARLTTLARPGTTTVCGTGNRLLDLHYTAYTANGRIVRIEEDSGGCLPFSNAATYQYDAMGRLTEQNGAMTLSRYAYDALGNMVAKDGRVFRYSGTRPHRLTHIDGAAVVKHDDNGNRTERPGSVAQFDAEDRLIDINNGAVRVAYDYSGRQVLRSAGTVTTRYFDELSEFRIERGAPILTKHYFAGDLRIASREALWQPALAALGGGGTLAAVGRWLGAPATQNGIASLLGLSLVALTLLPDRRRRSQPARRGTTIATLAFFLSAQIAMVFAPLATPRAWAGGGSGSKTVPLPTVIADPVALRHVHYHVDHLGTPQVLTDGSGSVIEHIRYRAFGEVRGRWDGEMRPVGAISRYGFAGYENEPTSGLQYAGVRWYDPDLGSFVSHDPARQYPNPYAYGGGDPINGVDRAGALFGLDDLLTAVLIGVLAGAAGAGINAAIQGASLGQSLRAALIGGALGGATAYLGVAVVAPALGETVVPAIAAQIARAGVTPAAATHVASVAVYGTTIGGGIASMGYEASRGHYAPLIAFGVAIGLSAALGPPQPSAPESGIRRIATAAESTAGDLSVSDLRIGDVLITRDGAMARVTQHAAVVLDAEGDLVLVLSADNRGIYQATNFDTYVGGRQWDVYRVELPRMAGFWKGVHSLQERGGLLQYLGNGGGNVCSSTVAHVIESGGGPVAPRLLLNLVTPSGLRSAYGPPIGRVHIPVLEGI